MINEILLDFTVELDDIKGLSDGKLIKASVDSTFAEALTAIYEIGLEAIDVDDKWPTRTTTTASIQAVARNKLRASQRKAWAKACGVAEK